MCGVLGWIGNVPKKKKDDFQDLITALFNETESRGGHASGFAAMFTNKAKEDKVTWSKLPVTASLFTDHDIYYRAIWSKNPFMFIGHTRFATSGSPSYNRNNHPFSANEYKLWMVHNGICNDLKKEVDPKDLKSDCDSEYLIRIVEKEGWDKGLHTIYNSSADFALLFIDKESRKLHVMRNDRPLWLFDAKKYFGTYIFSSTKEIFEAACKEVKLDIEKLGIVGYEIEKNTHYTISTKCEIEKIPVEVTHRPTYTYTTPYVTSTYDDYGYGKGYYNKKYDERWYNRFTGKRSKDYKHQKKIAKSQYTSLVKTPAIPDGAYRDPYTGLVEYDG